MANPNSSPRKSPSLLTWAILLPITTFALLGILAALPFQPIDLGAIQHRAPFSPSSFSAAVHSLLSTVWSKSASEGSSSTTTMAGAFLDTVKGRRSWYTLDKNLPIGEDKIQGIVQDAIQIVPSAFNSQSNRAVVLFGAEHDRLWDLVGEVLKARISEAKWEVTQTKIAGFRAAAGTILFFEDTAVIQTYAEKFPSYAAQFSVWSMHAIAMLQHTLWTALEAEGLGANLQHYNPVIDERVAEAWSLPATWRLSAQLVFGGRVGPDPAPKAKLPLEETTKVFGSASL